ncbi:transposase [Streptomyces collinus]
MHGEYKIPGGKLVVVDVEAEGGVLRHVRVAGDFFLEPDEALDAVNRALEGAPADTDAAGLAARIDAAVPEGTVMYGLTSEGVGIAVRRALAHATDWTDYDWQLTHEGPQAPALHMALDEVLKYSSRRNRQYLRRRQIQHTIPERRDQRANRRRRGSRGGRPTAFDRSRYARRNEVERCINVLKGSRAVATRYDKRAYVFHGTVTLAALRLWLRP